MKGQKPKPAAFMSYAHEDDKYGHVTRFYERLSHEVGVYIGEEFLIFRDREEILLGQSWKERIEESLDEVTFLIPIITPNFFSSETCCDELEQFLDREKKLGRNDLILPVYYVDCSLLNDEEKRAGNELAQVIAARQYADWRELRHEPFTSPQVGKKLEKLAVQIRDALERVQISPRLDADITRRPAEGASVSLPLDIESVIKMGELARRPSAKTEPPIRVVDPMHHGDHINITEAIEAANPGDRILVRPGLYPEGLVIDKPGLEIIGDGNLDDVVVQAAGMDTLLFKTTMGKVVNMTLRQMGGGDWFGVNITQGRLELEDCDITSQGLACVAIRGGADPRLRRTHIHDANQFGVFVYDNGQGVLEDNDIFGNASAGVAITSGGSPTLRRNRIRDSKQCGIFVYDNGQGVIEDNDIFGNALSEVAISNGGNPTLRRNLIHEGKGAGVAIFDNGQGLLEDNEIFENTISGVEIRENGNPTLRRNLIHNGKQDGVLVWESGQGTLEYNDIFRNSRAGVEIRTGGNPTVRHNHIHENKGVGVGVFGDGLENLEDNDIFGNALAGVAISNGGNPTLCSNRIHDGEAFGVVVYDNGQGALEDNDIFGNALPGVAIMEGGNPTLRRNRIHDGKQSGVLVYDNGQGVLEDNDIFGNALSGVEIKEDGNPTLRRNRVNKNGYWAVSVTNEGGGTIKDNDLSDNFSGAWNITPDSEPNLRRARNKE